MAVFRDTTRKLDITRPPARGSDQYRDLVQGLLSAPKRIPSKYFYDAAGSEIFSAIMKCPEYYLTACEDEILRENAHALVRACARDRRLNIVELGAGDGTKTRHLLREAQNAGLMVSYAPIDISNGALKQLETNLAAELEGVVYNPIALDLERELSLLPLSSDAQNLILYLGSSIGNLLPTEQAAFLTELRRTMDFGDHLLVGFDLKKPCEILMPAYNDGAGWTREFNLNILRRLNRELNADFNVEAFKHQPLYNPKNGAMESWLISMAKQHVHLWHLGVTIEFKAFEAIQTETSWKFSHDEIETLAACAGFHRVDKFTDRRGWFNDELWRKE
ncbi:MAG TPA: L-histidine N(alpha)-methyltransferase [Bdellovibrionales bacterium]|nr:L-histidine N(alpha)-methyltransferase [Bdellovibrionales bacterium]